MKTYLAPFEELAQNDFTLSVSAYITDTHKPPVIDIAETERSAQQSLLKKLRAELEFSITVAAFEGFDLRPLFGEIEKLTEEMKQKYLDNKLKI